MRFRVRPRQLARSLRELARRDPDQVSDYLDANPDEWDRIADRDPFDAADVLEALSPETAASLLGQLDAQAAAEVVEEMEPGSAAERLMEMDHSTVAPMLEAMDADEVADVLHELDEDERQPFLAALDSALRHEVQRFISYGPDTAGGMMRTDVAALSAELTTAQATKELKAMSETFDDLSYVYVVNDTHQLQGVLSFREMVFASDDTSLARVMVRDPVTVQPDADREEVAELIQRFRLFALPVVDADERLLGIVTVEEALEAIAQEVGEDMAVAVGAGSEESTYTDPLTSIRMRMPWIFVNLILATLVSLTIRSLEGQIEGNVVLASLMPIVALLGGNGGAQSLAVTIRAMAVNQVPSQRIREVIWREFQIGLALGVFVGLLSSLVAFVASGGDGSITIAMGIAVFANLSIGALAGASIPIVLRKAGFDPALASNIFLTFFTDVLGFAGFLAVAALLL
jgi:magnesium transporter